MVSLSFIETTAAIGAAAIASVLIFFVTYWFNRDPDRSPPKSTNEELIVSPSDGTVLYIKQFQSGVPIANKFKLQIPLDELKDIDAFEKGCTLVGIYLSPFDVHVTRAPISGKVTLVKSYTGQLFSRKLLAFTTVDERGTIVIEGNRITVGVVHMAAYLVRRVILNVRTDQSIGIGERIGRIRMGSQVDVVLPFSDIMEIPIKPGDRVRAGESVLAIWRIAKSTGELKERPEYRTD